MDSVNIAISVLLSVLIFSGQSRLNRYEDQSDKPTIGFAICYAALIVAFLSWSIYLFCRSIFNFIDFNT